MRAWYLDFPDEVCTSLMIGDMGLKFSYRQPSPNETLPVELTKEGLQQVEHFDIKEIEFCRKGGLPPPLQDEHILKGSIAETVFVAAGSLYLDVRDSADEWVRVLLVRGDVVTLSPQLFRRWALTDERTVTFFVLAAKGSGTLARLSRRSLLDADVKPPKGKPTRILVTELCAHFYKLGWVSGTGGSISIRHGDRVYMAPSGVQKELMKPEEIFVTDRKGELVYEPSVAGGKIYPSLSQCAPLFLSAYTLRDSGACIHTHDMSCVLITEIYEHEFRCTHQEMIKVADLNSRSTFNCQYLTARTQGIEGHGYKDTLIVPIIENTAHERDLADSLQKAIKAYPKSNAVLVRRHGVYVWGKNWIAAKTQAECYHYLFNWAYKMHQLGFDTLKPPKTTVEKQPVLEQERAGKRKSAGPIAGDKSPKKAHLTRNSLKIKAVVTDIEGTTTPISFVKDVLFPFAKDNVVEYLQKNWDNPKVQADVEALRKEASKDLAEHTAGAVSIPATGDRQKIIDACVKSVLWQMSIDRKSTALKQLQGHIWENGYLNGTLKGEVYDDVPKCFAKWAKEGLKVYIYSSGSREAQRLLFGWSTAGDLREYLSGYFDTTVGHKRTDKSYSEIVKTLGVDEGEEVLFLTDIYEEAIAARDAGLISVILSRPGNAPLPPENSFRIVKSFDELDLSLK